MWRVAANQPSGKRSCGSACTKNEKEPDCLPALSPRNHRVAQAVRLLETQSEDRSDKSGKHTGDEREQREHQ
jgi:hypothetical protein